VRRKLHTSVSRVEAFVSRKSVERDERIRQTISIVGQMIGSDFTG